MPSKTFLLEQARFYRASPTEKKMTKVWCHPKSARKQNSPLPFFLVCFLTLFFLWGGTRSAVAQQEEQSIRKLILQASSIRQFCSAVSARGFVGNASRHMKRLVSHLKDKQKKKKPQEEEGGIPIPSNLLSSIQNLPGSPSSPDWVKRQLSSSKVPHPAGIKRSMSSSVGPRKSASSYLARQRSPVASLGASSSSQVQSSSSDYLADIPWASCGCQDSFLPIVRRSCDVVSLRSDTSSPWPSISRFRARGTVQ